MREKSSATPISHKNFDFERFVPYLINHIGGRMAINFARAMQGSGIGYTMWRVLGILWWHKSLYLVEIAELANFELSTLSRIIAELESRKLVRRSTNRRRGKSFAVELTSQGIRLVEPLLIVGCELETRELSCLSNGERTLLIELLQKINRHLSSGDRQLTRPDE